MGVDSIFFNYFEIFLAVDCLVLVVYNVFVLFYRRVYTSWSTSSILICSSFLLMSRITVLVFYALKRNNTSSYRALVLSTCVSDIPCFFIQMISLAIVWQWERIAKLITSPEKAMDATYQKKSSRGFALM